MNSKFLTAQTAALRSAFALRRPGRCRSAMALAGILLCVAVAVSLMPGQAVLADESARTARPVLIGPVPASRPVPVEAVLALRNKPQLDALIKRLYDRNDPLFGKYLTPVQFSQQFGPTESDVDAVEQYFKASGLTVTKASVIQGLVQAVGPASVVERAFGVHLNRFVAPSGRAYISQDQPARLPADIAPKVTTVLGLYTGAEIHSFAHPVMPSIQSLLYSSGNVGLSPSDISSIYNLGPIGKSLTGSGQVIGLYENGTFTNSDLDNYEKFYNLHAPLIGTIGVDGYKTSSPPGADADEVTLDLDLILALASNVDQIQVYENTDQAVTDVFQQFIDTFKDMATINTITSPAQPLPTVISVSYGVSELFLLNKNNPQGPADAAAENAALSQLATQGQTVCVASGDTGAWTDQSLYPNENPNCSDPASEPYVTAVGGTNLTDTSTAPYQYSSESSWFDSADTKRGSYGTGGGGGVSVVWPAPTWQAGAFNTKVNTQGSTTFRNVPDVSVYGDFDTGGYDVFLTTPGTSKGTWQNFNGTSAACPIWAAYIADVNEQLVADGSHNLGFFNPTIYPLAESSTYAHDFHDISDGSTNGFYKAVAGYDNSTGWGSFNGANLFTDLTGSVLTTTTAIASSANPATIGQTVVLKASVTGNSPSGSIDFTVDGSDEGSVAMSKGAASYSATNLSIGTHTVTASYSGDSYNAPSSGTFSQVVNAHASKVAISTSNGTGALVYSQGFTITVAVTGSSPTGSVWIYIDGVQTLFVNVPPTTATQSWSFYSVGKHTLYATYTGDNVNAPSTSPTLTETVNKDATTTNLLVYPQPTIAGQSVSISASVVTNAPAESSSNLGGTLTFYDGNAVLDTPLKLDAYDSAAINVSSFATGSHSITAVYSGDANDLGSRASQDIDVAAPQVTGIFPNEGPLKGGATATILGANFPAGATVKFGTVPATHVVVGSSASITCTVPAGSAGKVDVIVVTPYGSSTPNPPFDQYTYDPLPTVASVSPNDGPLAGVPVTITGSGFVVGRTTVKFGKVVATGGVAVLNPTTIKCTAPAGSAGTVDVIVTTTGGQSSVSSGDKFTYEPVPTVSSLSHTAGPLVGLGLEITGTGFVPKATTVMFGKVAAAPNLLTVVNATTITCSAPPEAAGTVDVTVTTPGGVSVPTKADKFTYEAVPAVSSVSPSSGPMAGGTLVTLTGAGFVAGATVQVGNGVGTQVTVVSPTAITFKTPPGTVSAAYVTVTTPGGTSPKVPASVFRYDAVPTVTKIAPTGGPTTGGTAVTVTGTGFVAGATVKFGTVAATSVTVSSATTVTCKSPAHSAATVDVTVSTPGGTSAAVAADKFSY